MAPPPRIVLFFLLRGPSCDCHMPLAIQTCFHVLISLNVSHGLIDGAAAILMMFPAHSNGNGASDKTVVLT